jgi:hypothetical protein
MSVLSLMFMMFGLKVQKPVRRVKRGRSFTYHVICKLLASGHKGRKSKKWGRKRTTYKRRRGAR